MADQTCSLTLDSQKHFQKWFVIERIEASSSGEEKPAAFETLALPESRSTPTDPLTAKTPNLDAKRDSRDWSYTFLYHLRTLWLFTQSDLKSMIIPTTAFSLACSVSKSDLIPGQIGNLTIIRNLPYLVLWLWLTLLLFNLENQRLPSSVLEDSINKPWRPIPSGRIDANQARVLVFILTPVVLLVSIPLGTAPQALVQMALTHAYNQMDWADKNFAIRNFLNGIGISIYNSGAITIISGNPPELKSAVMKWVAFVGIVVATTIHVQDMKDQEGDALRDRKTLPLVMGDGFARQTIAVAITVWSLAAPSFWGLGAEGYMLTTAIGAIIVFRILWLRNVEADKQTWTWWCVWMVSLYLLPLWVGSSPRFWTRVSEQLCQIEQSYANNSLGLLTQIRNAEGILPSQALTLHEF